MKKVIILGGGIAGLTAAHELIERGFQVEVYEQNTILGGKARSLEVLNSGKKGRKNLPAEHGFRFFPGFYRHIPDTMKRIPYKNNEHGVFDNLVSAKHFYWVLEKHSPILCLSKIPKSLEDLKVLFHEYRSFYELRLTADDIEFFSARLWQMLTSCPERRLDEYEKLSWWEYVDAENRSKEYQAYLGIGQTKVLVASDPKRANARTIGTIGLQIIFNLFSFLGADRILNGPTNDVWINPWVDYLSQKGVKFYLGATVKAIQCEEKKIKKVSVKLKDKKITKEIEGDYYISALPVEVFAKLITSEMVDADSAFANLNKLKSMVSWMNGIQFYLKEKIDIIDGHESYLDSPWALTSLSQGQFWPDFPLSGFGDGKIKSILSVDISDWDSPGILYKKNAKNSTREEIAKEVWHQLKVCLNANNKTILKDEYLHSWFLDPDIQNVEDNPHHEINVEPLLVNLKDSWKLRPEAISKIKNLFLAGDYVKTHVDLATMEGANESARRAVNGLLDSINSTAKRCKVWKLQEPKIFSIFQFIDKKRFEQGLPWAPIGKDIVNYIESLNTFSKKIFAR